MGQHTWSLGPEVLIFALQHAWNGRHLAPASLKASFQVSRRRLQQDLARVSEQGQCAGKHNDTASHVRGASHACVVRALHTHLYIVKPATQSARIGSDSM